MKIITQLKLTIERAITFDYLAEALRAHTEALKEHSAALLTKTSTIDAIEAHAKYLQHSERNRNHREGRTINV